MTLERAFQSSAFEKPAIVPGIFWGILRLGLLILPGDL